MLTYFFLKRNNLLSIICDINFKLLNSILGGGGWIFQFINSVLKILIILKPNIINIYKYINYIIEIWISIQLLIGFQFSSRSILNFWFYRFFGYTRTDFFRLGLDKCAPSYFIYEETYLTFWMFVKHHSSGDEFFYCQFKLKQAGN